MLIGVLVAVFQLGVHLTVCRVRIPLECCCDFCNKFIVVLRSDLELQPWIFVANVLVAVECDLLLFSVVI